MKYDLGFILKSSRENASLTQEQAAELLDRSCRAIGAYENNETLPPLNIIFKMAQVYKDKLLFIKISDLGLEDIVETTITEAIVNVIDTGNKIMASSIDLIAAAADNKIDEYELPTWGKAADLGTKMIRTGIMILIKDSEITKRPSQDGNLVRAMI